MRKGFGYFLVIISGILISGIVGSINNLGNFIGFIILSSVAIYGIWLIYTSNKKRKEESRNFLENKAIKAEELKDKKEQEIKTRIDKVDILQEQIEGVKKITIPSINDYKKVIIDNETSIIKKGGENQLFSFLKIDSFLKDYRSRIVTDKEELADLFELSDLKNKIIEDSKRNELEKLNENLQSNLATLEGGNPIGFDANLESMFKIGRFIKPAIENQIETLEFYKNMAVSMIVFYQNDKKIRYFEIYEAFEKLGVFDSTWQKNVLNKLDKIEVRLAQISNQLTDLNQNFVSLIESSENIASELKEVNSNLMTNNMLQAITAYQSWKINKNTRQ